MKILSFLLIAIVATSTVGINILSYCCSHKEIAMYSAIGHHHDQSSKGHHTACDSDCICCTQHKGVHSDCCSAEEVISCLDESHDCMLTQECLKSKFIQLKAEKGNDFVFSFQPPVPVTIQLFDFTPEVTPVHTISYIAMKSPPINSGRDILAKHAVLLI